MSQLALVSIIMHQYSTTKDTQPFPNGNHYKGGMFQFDFE